MYLRQYFDKNNSVVVNDKLVNFTERFVYIFKKYIFELKTYLALLINNPIIVSFNINLISGVNKI